MGVVRWLGVLFFVAVGVGLAACGTGTGTGTAAKTATNEEDDGPVIPPDVLLAYYPLGDGQAIQPATPGQNYQLVMMVGHQDFPAPPSPPAISRVDVSPPLGAGAAPVRYTFLPGADPQLDAFLTRLADGVDDAVGGGWSVGTGYVFTSNPESLMLLNRPAWLTGPDLVGAVITRMVVDVTHVGFDPLDQTRFTALGRVSFYGVP